MIKFTMYTGKIFLLLLPVICLTACRHDISVGKMKDGDRTVTVRANRNYLLLPVEEKAEEAKMEFMANGKEINTFNIRLAQQQVDYWVPFDLQPYRNETVEIIVSKAVEDAVGWNEMKLSDTLADCLDEPYCPTYHFTAPYGWINDPNGMVYQDGEYHLFYQYNPYGSMWGNMHWGHAVSTDLVNWKHLPVALAPYELGTVFSGSAVIDSNNMAGFGANAMVAFYTSAGDKQTQSIAYSLDGGRTFEKYAKNPVLTSLNKRDFRDPKVFRYGDKWVMILAAGEEMEIFSSTDLKEWVLESKFGADQGAHGGVWECPDLFELPVEGNPEETKWVLICNLNPGGIHGGSATQYFIGHFDGKTFTNESQPSEVKWMDWGKDHYATVTWSDVPERRIAMGWMSNWLYANIVPTLYFRNAMTLPRELSLKRIDGRIVLSSLPVKEADMLRKGRTKPYSFAVESTQNVDAFLANNTGAYELELEIEGNTADIIGFKLFNSKGENIDFNLNLPEKKFSMDRRKSGLTDFCADFPAVTWCPTSRKDVYRWRIFVDKASVECFDMDGAYVMTNLIFPTEPYNRLQFYSNGGTYKVKRLVIYDL